MIAYLSLGTNLGDKRKNITEAIKNIGELVGDVVRQSALYETEPWGFRSDNRFVNAAVCVDTQPLVVGFCAAFISGCFACKWMINIVKKGKLVYFGIYCAIAGAVTIICSFA